MVWPLGAVIVTAFTGNESMRISQKWLPSCPLALGSVTAMPLLDASNTNREPVVLVGTVNVLEVMVVTLRAMVEGHEIRRWSEDRQMGRSSSYSLVVLTLFGGWSFETARQPTVTARGGLCEF